MMGRTFSSLPLFDVVPQSADAVILPQVLGAAYRNIQQLKAIRMALLIITSEFGTVSMWDWEIAPTCGRKESLR